MTVQQEIQTRTIAKIEEITKQFDERIAAETDNDRKNDHEKG